MTMLFHFNKIRSVVRTCIVFNNSEVAYISKLSFLGINNTENLNWSFVFSILT